MENFDLTLTIYFTNYLDIGKMRYLIWYGENQCNSLIKKKLDTITYTITTKGKPPYYYLKMKPKTLKYIQKNIDKFFNETNNSIDKGFALETLSNDWEYKSRDLDFYFEYYDDVNIGFNDLTLHFNAPLARKFISINIIYNIIDELINFLIQKNHAILYGLVLPMERLKDPLSFIAGTGTNTRPENENKLAYRWSKAQCKVKIWDVFWCNILNRKHIVSENLIKDIEKVTGKDSVKKINDDNYIFYLPFDIFEYDSNKNEYEKYRIKLRKVFDKYDLLMKDK